MELFKLEIVEVMNLKFMDLKACYLLYVSQNDRMSNPQGIRINFCSDLIIILIKFRSNVIVCKLKQKTIN